MGTVFVVGSLHFDVVVTAPRLPARDETLAGSDVAFVCGGKGGNQAVAAALHGAPTAMAGRVGDDLFAQRLLAHLDRAGVERAQVQIGTNRTSGMSVAIVDRAGDYGAVIVSGANLELDPARISLPAETRVVVLQNEIPEAVNLEVARRARAAGATVLLNAAPARELSSGLLALVDFLVVNRTEAAAMARKEIDQGQDALTAAASLACGASSVIVTLGAGGLVSCEPGGEPVVAEAFEAKVISAHGAGDVFIGALACRLAEREALHEAVRYAQGAAALHVATPVDARPSADPARVRELISRP